MQAFLHHLKKCMATMIRDGRRLAHGPERVEIQKLCFYYQGVPEELNIQIQLSHKPEDTALEIRRWLFESQPPRHLRWPAQHGSKNSQRR